MDFDGILLNPKWKMYELKTYRGVICHDNEEWCEIGRGIDLSFQNWHEDFHESWPEHLKISEISTLMGCLWPKYIMFDLKNYRGVMFDSTEYWCKIWRKTDLCMRNLGNFHQNTGKSKNWDFDGILLSKVENVWA